MAYFYTFSLETLKSLRTAINKNLKKKKKNLNLKGSSKRMHIKAQENLMETTFVQISIKAFSKDEWVDAIKLCMF